MTFVKGQYQTLKLHENVLMIKAHKKIRKRPTMRSPDKHSNGTGVAYKNFRNLYL